MSEVPLHTSFRADSERRENHLQRIDDFCLKATARIWPGLVHMFQVCSTAVVD